MPDIAPANGQFGDDSFPVWSDSGARIDAKYLKDSAGQNYVINPATSKPYVVPQNYDPDKTVIYFSNKLNEAVLNPVADEMAPADPIEAIYPHLFTAFKRGGWGDLQRPLPDKGDVVRDFIPAANLNYGLAAAAAGLPTEGAVIAGGAYNPAVGEFGRYVSNLWNEPTGWGNNPGNALHIRKGTDFFNQGIFGDSPNLNP
jgi:hypothetical protein